MESSLVDPALKSRMGAGASTIVAPYTPDRWAEAFAQAVEAILTSTPETANLPTMKVT